MELMTMTRKDFEAAIKDAWIDGYQEGVDAMTITQYDGGYTYIDVCWHQSGTYKSLMTKTEVQP